MVIPKLSKMLKHHRLTSGFTQETLSQHSEVSRATISNYETGRTKYPHPRILSKISKSLGLTIKDLLKR